MASIKRGDTPLQWNVFMGRLVVRTFKNTSKRRWGFDKHVEANVCRFWWTGPVFVLLVRYAPEQKKCYLCGTPIPADRAAAVCDDHN
jgi:hypothetical protein